MIGATFRRKNAAVRFSATIAHQQSPIARGRQVLKKVLRKLRQKKVDVPRADNFVAWVRLAVPGMTAEGNREAFEFVAQNLPETGSVIEIGSFCGLSTILLGHSLRKHGKDNSFFTCDKWEFEGQKNGEMLDSSTEVSHDDYKKYVKESYVRNIQTFFSGTHNMPHTIEEFSDDFFKLWRDEARARDCLLYTSPSPRDLSTSRMPSSA